MNMETPQRRTITNLTREFMVLRTGTFNLREAAGRILFSQIADGLPSIRGHIQ
jgi:hypothetical protein